MNKYFFSLLIVFALTGCAGMSDYVKNVISDPRNEKLVYKTDEDYSSGQIDLIIPPNLSQPNTTSSLSLPEVIDNESSKLFTIDTKLEGIKLFKQGQDMFLSVQTEDKILLWERVKSFWLEEGFQILSEVLTISSMRSNYLENLSEVQLGTIQRYVGRYVPLLVSPETRDSYKTRIVKKENTRVAKMIGINKAARTTCVKPAGTTSLVLGTSSGIHAWHNDYYIRRLRVGKNEPIYNYLKKNNPDLVADEYFRPHDTAVIEIPQSAPKGSILRTESAFDLLKRVKKVATEWVKPGHRKGSNTHNVSATISLKADEWDKAGKWMWDNRECYNGLSVLPYDGGTYTQAPFEDITEGEFNKRVKLLNDVDLSMIVETTDETDLSGELACAGGSCEISSL